MPASAVPLQVSLSPVLGVLLVGAALILLVGLVLAILRYLQTRRRGPLVAVVAMALGLAAVGGLVAYGARLSYERANTWEYSYSLAIMGNGSAPDSLVVPAPTDASLLSGLHLVSGTANWSLVDTPKGRGLFVRFTSSATIETTVTAFPRPATPPDTRPTMTVSTNCTAQPANCTGPPSLWAFYSGPAGAWVGLSMGSYSLAGYLTVGWAPYATWPQAVPTA